MKNIYFRILSALLTVVMTSCSPLDFLKDLFDGGEDEENTNGQAQYLVVDTNNETAFDCILFSEEGVAMTMFQCDDYGQVEHAAICQGDSILSVNMTEDGHIKSICNGEATMVFGYPNDSIVRISLVSQEETIILDDIDVSSSSITRKRSGSFDDFANWVEQSGIHQGLYEFSQEWGWLAGIINSGVISNISDIKNEKFLNLIWNSHSAGLSGLSALNNTFSAILDMASVVIDSRIHNGPWGLLINLLISYSSYVDLCEKFFDLLIPIMEQQEEEESIGSGAVNSGIGQLKATLTWGFYADIDIHAYEPTGSHIYFGNMYGDFGFLDVDNIEGGSGSVENIFWESPIPGEYKFYIDYFSGYQSGTCHVSIYFNNQGTTYNIPISSGSKYVATVIVPAGRSSEKPRIYIEPINGDSILLPKIKKH